MTLVADPQNVLEMYWRWNNAIAHYFFNQERADQAVFLSVDEVSLRRIGSEWQTAGDPADDFISSIRALIDPDQFFSGMHQYGVQYRNRPSEEPPKFIGGLALCVLAATRMGASEDNGVAAHNYYCHLNDLLGRPSEAGAPPFFDKTPALWELLAHWLMHKWGGRLGVPTARQVGAFRLVGWPISQALIRRSDKDELRRLRQIAGVGEAADLVAEDFLPALRLWLQEDGAYTRLGSLLGANPSYDALLQVADQLVGFADFEDEQGGADSDGRQLATLHLRQTGFTYNSVKATVAWRCPQDLEDEADVVMPDGKVQTVPAHGDWLGVNAAPEWFEAPVTLYFSGRKLLSHPSPPLVFVSGEGYGRSGWWVLRDREICLHQPCLIVCRAIQLGAVQDALTQHGVVGRTHEGLPWLPKDWVLLTEVSFTSRPEGVFATYQERSFKPWRLDGGVHIRRNAWLEGHLPVLDAAQDITFRVCSADGGVVGTAVGGTDLSDVGLKAGAYTLRAEGIRSRRIVVMSPPWPLPTPSDHRRVELSPSPTDKVQIRGALVRTDTPLPEPLFLPAGSYLVLGRRIGEIVATNGHNSPFHLLEWREAFKPVWCIRRKGKKIVEVMALQPPPEQPMPQSGGNRTHRRHWADVLVRAEKRLVGLTATDRAVFQSYVRIARGVDD